MCISQILFSQAKNQIWKINDDKIFNEKKTTKTDRVNICWMLGKYVSWTQIEKPKTWSTQSKSDMTCLCLCALFSFFFFFLIDSFVFRQLTNRLVFTRVISMFEYIWHDISIQNMCFLDFNYIKFMYHVLYRPFV